MPGDLLVGPVDVGLDVGCPALLGVRFEFGRLVGLVAGGMAVPPADAVLGDLLCLRAGCFG